MVANASMEVSEVKIGRGDATVWLVDGKVKKVDNRELNRGPLAP